MLEKTHEPAAHPNVRDIETPHLIGACDVSPVSGLFGAHWHPMGLSWAQLGRCAEWVDFEGGSCPAVWNRWNYRYRTTANWPKEWSTWFSHGQPSRAPRGVTPQYSGIIALVAVVASLALILCQNTDRSGTMNTYLVRSIEWAHKAICGAVAASFFSLANTTVAQTAYPEFYVGQATGSGIAQNVVQSSPSDALKESDLPMVGHTDSDGAIVLNDGLQGGGDWGFDSVGGAAACDCCPPRFYVIGEYLAINREGDAGIRLSQALQLGEFHYQDGFRATIGWTNDCLDGYEITFTHPSQWERGEFINGVNLQSNLIAAPNFNPADLSGFNNAIFHSQRYRSELYSGEFNRRWWGWDVFSVKMGLRYLNIDAEFEFRSTNNLANQGEFRVESDNHMFGPQLGIDLNRPIGSWTFQSRLNGAVMVNINDEQTTLSNGGTQWINNSFNDEDFAWMVETGVFAVYHLSDRLSAHVGYEGWFVDGVVIAGQQQLNPIDLNMGLRSDARGDIFYHGASAGFELVW